MRLDSSVLQLRVCVENSEWSLMSLFFDVD